MLDKAWRLFFRAFSTEAEVNIDPKVHVTMISLAGHADEEGGSCSDLMSGVT